MKITMSKCDNHLCNTICHPEGPRNPPYGWFRVRVDRQGGGHCVVDVCSIACISAVIEQRAEAWR